MRCSVVAVITVISIASFVCCSRTTPEANRAEVPLVLVVDVPLSATPVAAGEMRPGRQFGQTFVCKRSGLTCVEVLVATYAAQVPSGVLKIHLRANPEQHSDIASISVPAHTIKDNSYVALKFPPIQESTGKKYYVMLEAERIPMGYGLTVWRSDNDVYGDGALYVDGEQQPQDMCFRVSSVR